METLLLSASNPKDVALAAEILRRGGVVAIPTETVYGLAANAFDSAAAEKIFAAKGRPKDNPLIVHISDLSQIYDVCSQVPADALELARAFWPGPFTMVLPKAAAVPDIISAGLETVGVRIPAHPAALAVIREAGVPLAAPSANLSGRPSATCAAHAMHDFGGKIDAVLDGGSCGVGVESTVADMTGSPPTVLRPGAITREMIAGVLGSAGQWRGEISATPPSPGMKYRHYATNAPITLLTGSPEDTAQALLEAEPGNAAAICFDEYLARAAARFGDLAFSLGPSWDHEAHAHRLFGLLRILDGTAVQKIYAQAPRRVGRGAATFNRMERAAGGNVIPCTGREIIGVTGRSGSGKSLFAAHLASQGALALDADAIYRRLLEDNSSMRQAILARFPDECCGSGIDRRRLGEAVFGNANALADLNAITHPYVEREIRRLLAESTRKTAVLDVPILFGSGIDRLCTATVGIIGSDEASAARIVRRDGIEPQQAGRRLSAQQQDEFFIKHCDLIIENNGSIMDFAAKIDDFAANLFLTI